MSSQSMIRVAYDLTSLAKSPHGGIAQVCYHTARQASGHGDVVPVGCFRDGSPANLDNLGVAVRRVHPLSGVLGPTYDIAHSLCHRTLNVRANKSVYHVHDIWSLKPNPYQGAAFQQKVGKRLRDDILRADFVVAISETTRQGILDLNLVPEQKCRAIHLGYDISATTPDLSDESSFELPTERPYILFVGCLEIRKNLSHVIDAVASVSGVDLVIAGNPGFGYDDTIKPKLAGFPSERLHLLSDVDQSNLRLLYNAAVALLLPSWEEGFGLPIIEAMANGCPVITSNRSANAEIGGDAAILVNPEDPSESREAIERLIEQPDYRTSVVASGRVRAKQFTWEKYFDQLVEVYRHVLST